MDYKKFNKNHENFVGDTLKMLFGNIKKLAYREIADLKTQGKFNVDKIDDARQILYLSEKRQVSLAEKKQVSNRFKDLGFTVKFKK